MKKTVSLFLILFFLALSLCSCSFGGGSQQQKATITTLKGNTVQMSAKELLAAYRENMASFDELYDGAKVSLVATVSSVKTNQRYQGISTSFDEIICKEGWEVQLPQGHQYSLTGLSKGTKIAVEGEIYYGGMYINVGVDSFRVLG